jgi:hypothetical protein
MQRIRKQFHSLKDLALGSFPLTVGKYRDRTVGPLRGHDKTGVRLDCHHAPHDDTQDVPRNDGTVIALPEDVHGQLHRLRDKYKFRESLKEQVENDFDFIRDQLKKRGYPEDLIDESLQLVHHGNQGMSYINPYTGKRVLVDLYSNNKNNER